MLSQYFVNVFFDLGIIQVPERQVATLELEPAVNTILGIHPVEKWKDNHPYE